MPEEEKEKGEKREETNSQEVPRGSAAKTITTETTRGGDGGGEEGIGRRDEHGSSKDDAEAEGVVFDVGARIESEAPAALSADRSSLSSSPRTRQTQEGDGVEKEGGGSFERIERVASSSTLSTHGEGLDSLAQYVTGHSSTLDRGAAMEMAITDQGCAANSKENTAVGSSSERYLDDTAADGSQQPAYQSISRSETEDNIRGASGNTDPWHEIVVENPTLPSAGDESGDTESADAGTEFSLRGEAAPKVEQHQVHSNDAAKGIDAQFLSKGDFPTQDLVHDVDQVAAPLLFDKRNEDVPTVIDQNFQYHGGSGGDHSSLPAKEQHITMIPAQRPDEFEGRQWNPRLSKQNGDKGANNALPAGSGSRHDTKTSAGAVLHDDLHQEIRGGEVEQAAGMVETSLGRSSVVHAAAEIDHSLNHRGRETAQIAANIPAQVPTDELSARDNTPALLHPPSDSADTTHKASVDALPATTSPSGHVPSFDTGAVSTVAFERLQAGLMIRRQAAASVKIQAQARRWVAVRLYSRLSKRRDIRRREELEAQQRAATTIQAVIRGCAERREAKARVKGSENQRTRDEPMTRVTDSVHAYLDKDESTDRGTDDDLNNSDTSFNASSSEQQQQHHIDDTSSTTHTSRAGSASADNLGRREEESRTTEERSKGVGYGVHEKNAEGTWLGAERDSKGLQNTPGEQEILVNQWNQRSSTTPGGYRGVELHSPLTGFRATDEEDLQQDDLRREGKHMEPSLCLPTLNQEPDSLGGFRLDGIEVGKTSSASSSETSDGADVVYEEPASVGDDGDSDERKCSNRTGRSGKTSTGGGWSERSASTSASKSDSDDGSSHQNDDSHGSQQKLSRYNATEKNNTPDPETVDLVGRMGQGTVPLKRAAGSAGLDDGDNSDGTSSCSTGTSLGNNTSPGGGGWSERTASNSSSTSDSNDCQSHRNYGSERLQQCPPGEATETNNVFDSVAAADHAGRVEQEAVLLGGTKDEARYAREVDAVEKMVGGAVKEGVQVNATAPLERLEDLRSLVTEQAEATARIAMAATWTEASRHEAGRMRYAHTLRNNVVPRN